MARAASLQQSTHLYLSAGVSAAKLGIGIGFYAQCWSSPVNGPRQPISHSSIQAVSNAIAVNSYYNSTRYIYDPVAESATLSFPSPTGPLGCTWVTYEDARSIAAKAAFASAKGLGGTIIWQLAQGVFFFGRKTRRSDS
jgi:chitinase